MAEEVLLRNVIEDDLPILFQHQIDPIAAQMAAFPSREQSAFMTHWKKILNDGSIIKKTILLDGQVAGNIVCFEQDGELDIGYWVGREFWGKGVATRAVAVFLEIVEERPLFAHVVRHNTASQRVLEKCGFAQVREEGEELIYLLR